MTSHIHQDTQTSPINHLPYEVVELILSKCPVKSVVRFKSVSKSWQSIITTPQFSRILQSKLLENLRNKFFMWEQPRQGSGLYLVSLQENGKFQRESVLGYPSREFLPLYSCNGLILLYADPNKYMVWNPLIKKHIMIPSFNPGVHRQTFRNRPPELQYFNDSDNPLCSQSLMDNFYYDLTTDDHKIVCAYENCYTVYSCKNESWDVSGFPSDFCFSACDTCFDGCFYLMRGDEIEYLDTRDGKVQKLRQPNDVKSLIEVELWEVSERVCLYGWSEDHRRFQLWVLKKNGRSENSWRKLISLEREEADPFDLWPLCLSNEDLVVLWSFAPVEENVGKFKCFIYNPRENSFQKDDFDWDRLTFYYPYSETLYMPSSNALA